MKCVPPWSYWLFKGTDDTSIWRVLPGRETRTNQYFLEQSWVWLKIELVWAKDYTTLTPGTNVDWGEKQILRNPQNWQRIYKDDVELHILANND